jgi:hypothetical protein
MLTVSDLNDLIDYKDDLENKLNKIKDVISADTAMNVIRMIFNKLNDSEILSTTTLNKKLHYFNDTYFGTKLLSTDKQDFRDAIEEALDYMENCISKGSKKAIDVKLSNEKTKAEFENLYEFLTDYSRDYEFSMDGSANGLVIFYIYPKNTNKSLEVCLYEGDSHKNEFQVTVFELDENGEEDNIPWSKEYGNVDEEYFTFGDLRSLLKTISWGNF